MFLQVESPVLPILIIVLIAGAMGVAIYLHYLGEKKRREALRHLAASLGLQFFPAKDRGLAKRYAKLDELRNGSNRYAYNVLSGDWKGIPVERFDYHYEVTRSTGKTRSTEHYYLSVLVCRLPLAFPETRVYREGIFEKMIQMIGFEDIHFESAEFSRRYTVRSKSKKFAYDFIHPRAIDYLLDASDLNIEIEEDALALVTKKRLEPDEIPEYLAHLGALRGLMPDYLFA
ncbi:MAG: hypothetical protein WD490_06520 [Opitutales bacterium]